MPRHATGVKRVKTVVSPRPTGTRTPELIKRGWEAKRNTATMLTEAHSREVRDLILSTGMEDGLQEALDLLEEVAVSLL